MPAIDTITSRAIPFPVADVDTDQIIPARYLKATTTQGFGEYCFRDLRFDARGRIQPDFALNDSRYEGEVLLAGPNFGCGSSREHAAWALRDFGFRVIIASAFADIFRNNASNNGLLAAQVSEQDANALLQTVIDNPKTQLTIDLPNQKIKRDRAADIPFQLPTFHKTCLLEGKSPMELLLSLTDEINQWEAQRATIDHTKTFA